MKKSKFIIIFLFLFSVAFYAQDKKYAGTYAFETSLDSGGVIKYELTLNKNGTFTFVFFQDQIFFQERKVSIGNWENKLDEISFMTPPENLERENSLDFTNTKAYIDGKKITIYETLFDDFVDIVLKK